MNFTSEKTQILLKRMGWFEGRNIPLNELKLPYNDYPEFVLDFLQKYGNIEGECERQEYTEVVNKIFLIPETESHLLIGDNYIPYYQSLIGKKLYPLGAYDGGNGYDICCDADGRVYMIGEYCYHRGENLHKGIENIILGFWKESKQLDENTGKWWNREGEHKELPPV